MYDRTDRLSWVCLLVCGIVLTPYLLCLKSLIQSHKNGAQVKDPGLLQSCILTTPVMCFWLWFDSRPASFQHEVIAVSEKVIVRLDDLVKWTVPDFSGWSHCLKAEPLKQSVLRELGNNGRREALHRYRESTLTSGLNFKDVQREKAQLGERCQKGYF